jgi:hypothetical protein
MQFTRWDHEQSAGVGRIGFASNTVRTASVFKEDISKKLWPCNPMPCKACPGTSRCSSTGSASSVCGTKRWIGAGCFVRETASLPSAISGLPP